MVSNSHHESVRNAICIWLYKVNWFYIFTKVKQKTKNKNIVCERYAKYTLQCTVLSVKCLLSRCLLVGSVDISMFLEIRSFILFLKC